LYQTKEKVTHVVTDIYLESLWEFSPLPHQPEDQK